MIKRDQSLIASCETIARIIEQSAEEAWSKSDTSEKPEVWLKWVSKPSLEKKVLKHCYRSYLQSATYDKLKHVSQATCGITIQWPLIPNAKYATISLFKLVPISSQVYLHTMMV